MKKMMSRAASVVIASVCIAGFTGCQPDTGYSTATTVNALQEQQQDENDSDSHPGLPAPGTPAPTPTPTLTPPTAGTRPAPGKKPPSKSGGCHDKDNDNSIPPAVIDALVMQYGCVDSSEKGKQSDEKKIQICHIPPGNPAKAHSICVAVQGAVNGHALDVKTCKSPETGDYCGACRAAQ